MRYRKEIDGLRALAVMAVIANHVDKNLLPSGFLGVDVFFVISGYVITASFHGRPDTSLPNLLAAFYARRVKRLLPALVVCVVVTALLISLFNPQPHVHLLTGVAALFGVANLYLIKQASSYFGEAAQLNPMTHTWSLGVEEQFYLLFPLLVWATQFGSGRSQSGRRFYTALAILSVASLGLFAWLGTTRPHIAYYFMPARFWELACGAFAFWLAHRAGAGATRRTLQWLSSGVLVLLALTLFAPVRVMLGSTVACVALTVGLIVCSRPGTWSHGVLASRPLVYIGLISYSLYLWHWPVLTTARWTVGVTAWTLLPLLLTMLAVSAASYRWIERPLRLAPWSVRQPATVGIGLAGASAAAAVLLVLASPPLSNGLYQGKRPETASLGIGTLLDRYVAPSTSGSGWSGKPCVLESNQDVGKPIALGDCTLGDFDSAGARVLVLGDSYAAAFVQAFDPIVRQDRYAVTLVSSWGASAIRNLPNHTPWKLANRDYWDRVVPQLTSRLRPGDWVFLVSDMAIYSSIARDRGNDEILDTLSTGIASFAQEMSARQIRVAVMHANPFIREANCEPAAATPQWFTIGPGPCKFLSRRETLERRTGLDQRLKALAQRGSIVLVDLMDLFCPAQTCNFQAESGALLYRDVFSHPSVEAARLSAATIRSRLIGD